MTCPHCMADLKQKERGGNRCGRCRREFALDPKHNRLLLHDLRLRKLADQLSDGGRLRYTATQLWYASARKTLRADESRPGGFARAGLALLLGTVAVAVGAATDIMALLVVGALALLFCAGTAVATAVRPARRVTARMSFGDFRGRVIGRWTTIYGAPPPGLIDEDQLPALPPSPRATVALLCPDRSVLACLLANRVPERLGIALAATPAGLPPALPVAVLHDASPAGYLFAAHARAVLAGREMRDAAPRPRALVGAKGAVRLRDAAPDARTLSALQSAGQLTRAELDWLAKGWWSPVAAIRPAALIARVESVVARSGDPDRRAASAVGFMTWPGR